MSIVNAAGEITQLSISQVEKADPKQTGGCLRRWWFETPQGLKPEQAWVQNEGTAGHALLARFLTAGENPKGRTLMGKAVTGAILKGDLPTPGPDLIVEKRFSGQDMRDDARCECGHSADVHDRKGCARVRGPESDCDCTSFTPAWVPLNTAETLHLAGVPWDGAIDLAYRRGDRPVILDHKFSSDPDLYAKKNSELIKTVQMPVYVHSQIPYWPDAREFEIAHHYVSKKGVHSFMRRSVVTVDQVAERIADVEAVVGRMRAFAGATKQDDVPASPGAACEAWTGCPHQSICSSFKRRNTNPGAKAPMALSEAEQAIFDSIPGDDAPAMTTPEPEPVDDSDEAALKAQLDAAQKALEEKQKKRTMKIVDVEPEPVITVPPPVPAAETAAPACGKCSTPLTAENGSKLQDGSWKHIGCKADAPPAPPPKQRASSKKSEAPPIPKPAEAVSTPSKPPAPTPVAPRVFAGERESDRAATAAMDAARAAAPTPPMNVQPMNIPVMSVDQMIEKHAGVLSGLAAIEQVEAREQTKRRALASVFDSIAALLRAA